MPCFSVSVEDGQPAQEPRMLSRTMPSLVVPGVEGDVAAIARHGGAHARVDDLFQLFHDVGGFAFIDDVGFVGFVRGAAPSPSTGRPEVK